MIDLHCHLLPGIDDGATDLDASIAMARIASADGIRVAACTPHDYPGLYDNGAAQIRAAVARLQSALSDEGIPLTLLAGADVHLRPGLIGLVRDGSVATLAGSRYLLLEPPHHVAPPRFEDTLAALMAAGIVPVITHPERLSWVEYHYATFVNAAGRGVWLQVTAGALTGRFGQRARYWAERFVGEGHVHLLATDAHDAKRRPPLLAEARDAAAALVGAEEAGHLVRTRPQGIVDDVPPDALPPSAATGSRAPGRFRRRQRIGAPGAETWS
ncbi:MAG: hypothetical protein NVV68_15290 [Dokdonella sp.]|jgi:protein-tyrosine phosphatase|nr:hypothetical protein [Dokdonella sp.]